MAANDELERAERAIKNGRLAEAEIQLKELKGRQPYFHEEIDQLLDQANRARRLPVLERAQDVSTARAIDEVGERLVLPDTYGETRIITPDNSFDALPMGPMERLAAKPISLNVQDADLRTLIMTLSEIDGLNIIADDALTADQTLTMQVNDVPLREILGYEGLLAGECQQPLDERGAAIRSLEYVVDVGPFVAELLLEQLGIALNDSEQVIEVVRDAAGELSDGFHLLGMLKSFLDLTDLCDVCRDAANAHDAAV